MMAATFPPLRQTGRFVKVKLADGCKAALQGLEMKYKNLVKING